MILLLTGIRRGELLALTWESINLTDKTISITDSRQYRHGGFGVYNKGGTKTVSGIRCFVISQKLVDELIIYKHWYDNTVSLWTENENYLIVNPQSGKPIFPTVVYKWLAESLENCGLKRVSVHSLRHLFISLSVKNGVAISAIAQAVGHARVTTTLNNYTHFIAESSQDVANSVDRLFDKQSRI